MGFWNSVTSFFGDLFGGDDDEPAAAPTSFDIDTPDYGSGYEDQFSWSLAGYVPVEGSFKDDYQNVEAEGMSSWRDALDCDYIVVKVTTAAGDEYYTTLAGPFADYEDFEAAIADWWEQGS